MIIFCEECGARNDLSSDSLDANLHTFECCKCGEVLMVSKPTVGNGGFNAFARMTPENKGKNARAPITVLVVDDSTVLRKIIREMFASDDQLQVVGEAEHGLKALELIPRLKPDVVTLDVNMPVMDGLTTIKHIMIKCPTPVVMFSTLTGQGSRETFDTLRYGAVDFLQKPSSLLKEDLKSQHELIISRVKNAARAGIDTVRYLRPARAAKEAKPKNGTDCSQVFAIGSSYGGYGSLLGLIPELSPDLPAAFLSVLYAAPPHVDAFARYLDEHSPLAVCRAQDGQTLAPGSCYLASVFEWVTVANTLDRLTLQVAPQRSTPPKGASDELMTSLSTTLKERASGILLSGIGDDGIAGIEQLLNGGGKVIVQDPKTCLCSDTTAMAAQKYGLPTVLPGVVMAETIRTHCLNASHR
ncbi:chemotaxis response regulator protein-glutamate methylesterase [Desulfosarcina alkanivorans]|uniref:protein-glutamate methylesterase n=1 Tax=Desulfosarcina alkanivorans TaxID=571177 RepID=A0A5K7YT26_9BACT|nr:chemotaxis protein CheB [Desulfosarcina alkanivorans]BBO72486.1 chemotaxis response regulator protein-glutamate methylesterase [Desulfosarcina alkanivorans]